MNRVGSGLLAAPLLYLLAEEFGGQGSRLLTLGLLLLLWGPIAVLLRAFRAAYLFALTPLLLIHASSRIKHQLLGYPAYFWDLKYQVGRDQWDVLVHYFGTSGAWSLVVGTFLFLSALAWHLKRVRAAAPVVSGRRFKLAVGAVAAGLALTIAGWQLLNREAQAWKYPDLVGRRHPIGIFLVSAVRSSPELLPPPISPGKGLNQAQGVEAISPQGKLPHLIMILQESLTDPRMLSPLWKTETRWDSLIRPGQAMGAPSGALHVPVFGGGTWCSEFTSLSGIPSSAFGIMQGYVTYVLEGKVRESLVSQLKRLGYRTVSLYATPGEFLNGGRFHQSLGFDEFLDSREQERVHGTYWQLSDRQIYETATRVIEHHEREHPGQPLFLWMQTIRNHGPHGEWKGGECARLKLSPWREVVRAGGYDPDGTCPLVDYLDRIEQSQLAYGEWKRTLASRFPQDLISIVQFGDHHPILTENLRSSSGEPVLDEQSRHTTFYAMDKVGKKDWPRVPNPGLVQGRVDLAYLGALWLRSLGLPLSKVQESLLRTGDICRWAYPQDSSSMGGTPECLQALGRHHGLLKASGALLD